MGLEWEELLIFRKVALLCRKGCRGAVLACSSVPPFFCYVLVSFFCFFCHVSGLFPIFSVFTGAFPHFLVEKPGKKQRIYVAYGAGYSPDGQLCVF